MLNPKVKIGVRAVASLLCLAGCASQDTATLPAASTIADTIYVGGAIVTVDDAQPLAEALAVRNGIIVALGNRRDLLEDFRGDSTQVVELAGRTLIPAFIDPHSHYVNALSAAGQANVHAPPAGPGSSVAAIQSVIHRFRSEHVIPPGALIQAYGYDEDAMPDGRVLTRDDLDAAFPDNPVVVGHVSMHGGVLNSAALERFGIAEDATTTPGGIVVRKPGTNEPWGLIMESAYLPVFAGLPTPAPEQAAASSRGAQLLYAEAGITLAQDGATRAGDLDLLQRISAEGAHIIDVVAYPYMTDLDSIVAANPLQTWGTYRDRLKIGGVKITADGSPQGRTAYFSTPYLTGGPGGEKNWRGEPTMPQPELDALVLRAYAMQVPLLVHANGDAAIDMLLEACDKARAGDFTQPWNVTAIHAQFLRRDQILKFVEFGIRPSFNTLDTYYFASANEQNRGAEQAAYISPMRDAIDAGLRPTNHTDFYAAPLDQLFVLWSAVNRMSQKGVAIDPTQTVTPLEALKAQTLWAAEQYGEAVRRGSLEVGKIADLVILDANPLTVDPMSIKDIRVLETIKDGKTIYRRETP